MHEQYPACLLAQCAIIIILYTRVMIIDKIFRPMIAFVSSDIIPVEPPPLVALHLGVDC